jgi:hypothetical protein
MAGKIKVLQFAEGISTSDPTQYTVDVRPVGSQVYEGTTTLSQTIINLGFTVDLTVVGAFDLFIDGFLLAEGASGDYQFTSVVDNKSSQVTLNTAMPTAGLNIYAIYRQTAYMDNPMTTVGDLIVGDVGGQPDVLPIGSEGTVLTSISGSPTWAVSPALSNPMTSAEDLIVGGAGGTPERLAKGTDGQVLTISAGEVTWEDTVQGFVNPMTTAGDLIKGGTAGAADRLAIGDENKVLTSKSGTPSWEVAQLDDLKGSATIANNQLSAADVTGALLDNTKSYFAKIDYSIDRRYTGDISLPAIYSNIIDGSKFNTYSIAYATIMLSHSSGMHFIGGSFVDYGGTSGRNRLIAFDGNGNLDTTFLTAAVDGTKFSSVINTVVELPDGDLLIGGVFANYGATGRNRLVKMSPSGVLDAAFNTNAVDGAKFSTHIYGITKISDGKIAISGNFLNYAGATGKSYLVVLNSDGTEHSAFNTAITNNLNGTIFGTVEIASNKLLVYGAFTNYAGTSNRSYAIVLNIDDGTVDTTLTGAISDSATKFNNAIYSGLKTSDSGFIVGGAFTNYGGITNRNRLLKFKSNGSVDLSFTNLAVDGGFIATQLTTAYQTYLGRLVLVGSFQLNAIPYYGRYGVAMIEKTGIESRESVVNFNYGMRFPNGGFTSYETPCGKIFLNVNTTNIDGVSGRNYVVAHAEDGTFAEKPYRQGTVYAYYNAATSAWELSKDAYQGESRGVTLSITSGGQLQYTSNKRTGTATTNTIKYFVKYL